MNVLDTATEIIDKNFGEIIFKKAELICAWAAVPFSLCFGSYFVLCLLEYKENGMSNLCRSYVKLLIAWFFISIFAFNSNIYYHLAQILYGLPEELMSIINPNETSAFFSAAYNNLNKLTVQVLMYIENKPWWATVAKLISLFICCLNYILGTIIIEIIFVYYKIAKIILSLVLFIGPLFIGFLLFPATRQWGMNWIGQALNQILLIFIYSIISIIFSSYTAAGIKTYLYVNQNGTIIAKGMNQIISITNLLTFTGEILFMGILFIFILWKLPSITAGLFGGSSTEGLISGGVRTVMFPARLLNKGFRMGNSKNPTNSITGKNT